MAARLEAKIEDIKSNEARTESNHEEMIAKLDAFHERMMASLGKTEATDLEANPEEMQPEAMHREVPKKEAAAKYSGAVKKRHRGQHLAAGPRGQPEERTRGNFGSRKKLAAACRKMTRSAEEARFKAHVVRKN
jgi:hypothetical protein